ncbi:NAD-dependent epimerase/dehydratase family protein [Herminiimonas sp. NPDC097707]|uniref:NAD-dependent epimerase/dehydratase family protein n=1 Tax=Herminiimonas sp. NPDC097707 TaxID=3364007 RepID=UPI00383B7C16
MNTLLVKAHPDSVPSRTLVIGGGGYIGSYLVPLLIASGRKVTVLGKSAASQFPLPVDAVYVSGDFGQKDLIRSLLDSHQEIVHLAYASKPNTSFHNPLEDLLQNLPPTVQLFSEIAARGGKLILISSGGTVYGEAQNFPIREDHSTQPISPYGLTKLTLENYARLYAMTHDLRYVCIRPSNAYGVGQRPFAGQGFISTAMGCVMRGQPIQIFGEEGAVRDYIYVSDLASGVFSAMQFGKLSETYNLGSGIGFTNRAVIEMMTPSMKMIGFDVKVEHLPERPFDVKANVLDTTKLKSDTGWQPNIGIDEGLALTAKWMSNFNG